MAGVKRPRALLDHSDSVHDDQLRETRAWHQPAMQQSIDVADHHNPSRTRTPSPSFPPLTEHIANFSSDASIVFAGIRGAGKSTLAIMASSAMKRKVLDLETAFQRAHGVSSASYKKVHGSTQCHRQQAKILQGILDRNPRDAVIVCSWMESGVQKLLRQFAATNPVVHVVRDIEAIQEHLKIKDRQKMENLLNVSKLIFRTCTNYELFNVSEHPRDTANAPSSNGIFQRLPAPYLTLKQAERHLLKFLSLVYPPDSIPFIESAFPLATMPPENRDFTYALHLPLSEILKREFDLEEHIAGADAVQIAVSELMEETEETPDAFLKLASRLTMAVGIVRRSSVLPVLIDIELPESAEEWLRRLYYDLVAHALRSAPEMVTLDLRLRDAEIAQFVASNRRTAMIAQRTMKTENSPPWDSPLWVSLYRKASKLGCNMVRLVRPASSIEDNFAINDFRTAIKGLDCCRIPLTAYNSGSLGRYSAVMNRFLTPVKAELLKGDAPSAPCITARDATSALCSAFVFDPMNLYVFGVQVGYSMSPAMHNAALRACGLHFQYQPYSTDTLQGIRHLIEDPHFGGASIGLPYKVEVITLTMEMSRHAKAIGAVNTLIPLRRLAQNGSLPPDNEFYSNVGRAGPVKALYGDNTDWIGIKQCIRRGLSPANAVKPATCGVVIGAGGMSRAAVYAILQLGVQNIAIFNRTVKNAETLATHFTSLLQRPDFQSLGGGSNTRFHVVESRDEPWPSQFSLPTIIVSCIPTHRIGDTPAPDFTVPDEWLGSRTGGVVLEFGYKTLKTPLLSQAKREASRGWVAMDGLDILPEQGYAQFELFTGRRAPRRIMRRDLLRGYMDEQGQTVDELQSRLQTETDPET